MPKTAKIESLLAWVRFSVLPVDHYTGRWLERAGNKIGRTTEVDKTTLLASRDKFARLLLRDGSNQIPESGLQIQGRATKNPI